MDSFCDDTIYKLPSDENGFVVVVVVVVVYRFPNRSLLWIVIGKLNVRFGDFDLK